MICASNWNMRSTNFALIVFFSFSRSLLPFPSFVCFVSCPVLLFPFGSFHFWLITIWLSVNIRHGQDVIKDIQINAFDKCSEIKGHFSKLWHSLWPIESTEKYVNQRKIKINSNYNKIILPVKQTNENVDIENVVIIATKKQPWKKQQWIMLQMIDIKIVMSLHIYYIFGQPVNENSPKKWYLLNLVLCSTTTQSV